MPQERIYILKAGVDVPKQFDGVTIPFTVPGSIAEALRVAGGSEDAVQAIARVEATFGTPDLAARNNAVNVFNQAHALNIQKDVKAEAQEEGATVEKLRDAARTFKYGQVRVRSGSGNGAARVKPATVGAVLGDDFLATLSPEQRKLYDAKMAALNVKKDEVKSATPAEPAAAKSASKK